MGKEGADQAADCAIATRATLSKSSLLGAVSALQRAASSAGNRIAHLNYVSSKVSR